jgi:hypothetical protein
MNPYVMLGSRIGTAEAASLSARLAAWHDAMVTHERRLRTGRTADKCDEECPARRSTHTVDRGVSDIRRASPRADVLALARHRRVTAI